METASKRAPLFSNRALLNLGVPLALNSLMAIFMGMADSVMVSSAGATAVSAVSIVDAVNNVFVTVSDSIPTGGSVVTSQYIGARQQEKAKESIRQILYSGIIIATFLMVLLLCLRKQVLRLIYGSIETAVFNQAVTYFTIILLSFPFLVAGCTATATLRSMAKSRLAVTITISANIINVIGNAILIYGFDLGVAGAAISTVFGRIVWCIWGLMALRSEKLPVKLEKVFPVRIHWDIMKRVLRVGLGTGFENSLLHIGRLALSSLSASFGTIYIAAYSLSNTLNNFGWVMITAVTTTAMTVVGQCIGAGEKDQARQYAKKLLTVGCCIMLTMFSLIFLLRHQLVSMYQLTPEELEVAAYNTGILAILTMCSCYFMAFTPMGIFRAAGDMHYPVIVACSAMVFFRVGLSYLLCYGFQMGLMGIWLGMSADWAFRSVCNTVHFLRGKWLDKKLI